jgi:hypothetical protein
MGWTARVQISAGSTQTSIQWLPGAISPRVKRPEHEADHSPPSSAEVKNGRAIPPLSLMSSCQGV